MSVKLDSEARALIKLLENFDDFNDELINGITNEMRSSNGTISKRFERKVGTQRTYEKLKPKTVKQKAKKNQRNVMVARGTLKGRTLATMKGKLKGDKVEFSARVPEYGKVHQEGIGKMPKREFFSLNDKDGRLQPNDVSHFNRTVERQFNKLLARKGLHVR